jgi:hypothetical protein
VRRLLSHGAIGLSLLLCACQLRVTGGGGEAPLEPDASQAQVSESNDVTEQDAALAASQADASTAHGEEQDAARANEGAAHDAAFAHDAEPLDGAAGGGDLGSTDGAVQGDAALSAEAGTGACMLSGSFATELLFDVGWNQTTLAGIVPLLAAGTGQLRIVVRLDLGGSMENASARLTACGTRLPDFKASNALIGTEYYAAYVPDGAWDNAAMPHPAFGLSFGCAEPGCALTTDHVVATFGARTFPDDVWPGRTGPIKQLTPLDQDGDGHPGVTFVSRGADMRNALGVAYENIPVTWTLGERAPEADVAFRVTGVFTGKVAQCDLFTGVVSSGSVEARAVGCRVRRDNTSGPGAECAADQSSFLDQNLPDWQVRGGTFRARRVADDANCSVVRAALQ